MKKFFTILLLPLIGNGFIADVTSYYDYKNDSGESLASMIEPFRVYGEKTPETISVTILGAVKRPGIYYIKKEHLLFDIIQSASPLANHPAVTYYRIIKLYRKNKGGEYQELQVNAREYDKESNKYILTDVTLEDGDTINVPALVL